MRKVAKSERMVKRNKKMSLRRDRHPDCRERSQACVWHLGAHHRIQVLAPAPPRGPARTGELTLGPQRCAAQAGERGLGRGAARGPDLRPGRGEGRGPGAPPLGSSPPAAPGAAPCEAGSLGLRGIGPDTAPPRPSEGSCSARGAPQSYCHTW